MLKSDLKHRNKVSSTSHKAHPRNTNLKLKATRSRLRNKPVHHQSTSSFSASSITSSPLSSNDHPTTHTTNLYNLIESDPFLGPIHTELSKVSPSFPVSSCKIHPIDTPNDFYEKLLSNLATAKHRIVLSALYLGSDAREVKLVETIDIAMQNNSDLHVLTLFDKHRGQRLDTVGNSSYNLFLNLSKKYPGRVCSALYTPPCLLSSEIPSELRTEEPLFSKIGSNLRHFLRSQVKGRAKELFSVHHMKAYVTDDTLIMSGANLSDIYFTNRQDRYLQIQNRDLADYASAVIQTLSFGSQENTQYGFYDKDSMKTDQTLPTFIDSESNPWFEVLPYRTMNLNDEKKQIQMLHQLLDPKVTSFFNTRRLQRQSQSQSQSPPHQSHQTQQPSPGAQIDNEGIPDMLVYPSIQLAAFGIQHDEKAMTGVLHRLSLVSLPPEPASESTTQQTNTSKQRNQTLLSRYRDATKHGFFAGLNIHMLTGYFNVSKVFLQSLAEIAHNYATYTHGFFDYAKFMELEQMQDKTSQNPQNPHNRFLLPRLNTFSVAACREANGWWKAGGLPGHIPDIYKSIIDGFNDRAAIFWNTDLARLNKVKSGLSPKQSTIVNIHALEYQRDGWSYHAKGLFVQPGEYFPHMNNKAEDDANFSKVSTILQRENIPGQPMTLLSATKPLWTTVGSSNYGYRSLHLDSELQLSLLIPSQIQRDRLLNQDTISNSQPNSQPDLITQMNDDLGNSMYFSSKHDKIFVHPAAYALRPIVKYFL